jgi:hypothetical protein
MPKYFFNTHHDVSHIDHDGEEFADKYAAWAEATRMAGEIIKISMASCGQGTTGS